MKIGDQIDHKSIGPCTVTHIWLRDIGVTPDDGCEGETIIIPRESAMEMTDDDQPRDANGEVLGAGDLIHYDSGIYKPHDGFYLVENICSLDDPKNAGWMNCGSITAEVEGLKLKGKSCEKITSLTRSQYLPLAKRTLDPGMTRRELLSMLTMGCVGEWGEFQRLTSWENCGDELGDLMWYTSLLQDEAEEGQVRGYGFARGPSDWIEMAKKEIYHGTNKGFVRLMASYLLDKVKEHADLLGLDIDEIRYRNIRKLIDRYPDGFVSGGGRR